MKTLMLLIILLVFTSSCTDVKPWQKGTLAKSYMAFDTDQTESKFMQHTYDSKEGSSGGYGVAGGGCGCN